MRNTPTGIMPVRECRRRQKNECPCPARSGATPARIVTGVVVLGVETATTLPCRLGDDQRLHHYLGRQEKKSRRARQGRCLRWFLDSSRSTTELRRFHKFFRFTLEAS